MCGYILDYMLHNIRNTAYNNTMMSCDKVPLHDMMVSPSLHLQEFLIALSHSTLELLRLHAEDPSLHKSTRIRVY